MVEVKLGAKEANNDEDMERVTNESPQVNTENRGLSDNDWQSKELFSYEGSDSDNEKDGIGSCGPFETFSKPKSMTDYK